MISNLDDKALVMIDDLQTELNEIKTRTCPRCGEPMLNAEIIQLKQGINNIKRTGRSYDPGQHLKLPIGWTCKKKSCEYNKKNFDLPDYFLDLSDKIAENSLQLQEISENLSRLISIVNQKIIGDLNDY